MDSSTTTKVTVDKRHSMRRLHNTDPAFCFRNSITGRRFGARNRRLLNSRLWWRTWQRPWFYHGGHAVNPGRLLFGARSLLISWIDECGCVAIRVPLSFKNKTIPTDWRWRQKTRGWLSRRIKRVSELSWKMVSVEHGPWRSFLNKVVGLKKKESSLPDVHVDR